MKLENEMKIVEEKLNYIYGICLRTGSNVIARGRLNTYALLVATFYQDFEYTDLKMIFKKINEICGIDMYELEDTFRFFDKINTTDYNDFMNTIISLRNIERYVFADYLLANRFYYETSDSLGRFASNILGQVPEAKLLDGYSGNGYFDCDYLGLNKSATIDGYEINVQSVNIARALHYIFDSNNKYQKKCNFIEADFLTEQLKENYYDLAFADCPIGLRYDKSKISNIELATNFVKNNMISIPWLTALKIEKSLNEKGKAVIVCSGGSLFGIVDREVRKYFVDKN